MKNNRTWWKYIMKSYADSTRDLRRMFWEAEQWNSTLFCSIWYIYDIYMIYIYIWYKYIWYINFVQYDISINEIKMMENKTKSTLVSHNGFHCWFSVDFHCWFSISIYSFILEILKKWDTAYNHPKHEQSSTVVCHLL